VRAVFAGIAAAFLAGCAAAPVEQDTGIPLTREQRESCVAEGGCTVITGTALLTLARQAFLEGWRAANLFCGREI